MDSNNMITKVAVATYGAASKYGGMTPFNGTAGRLELTDTGAPCGVVTNNASSNSLSLQIPRESISATEYIYSVELYGADSSPSLASPSDVTPWSLMTSKTLFSVSNSYDATVNLPSIPGSADINPNSPTFVPTWGQPVGTSVNMRIVRDISPPGWGPASGTWQPHSLSPKTDIPIDFDNDGLPDYQIPGGDVVPGGGGLHYGQINLDDKYLTLLIWRDLDGDGIIDRNEVISVVGQCRFPSAKNAYGIYKDDLGHRHIYQENINTGGSYFLDPPGITVVKGGKIIYDYDVETGKLVVVIINPPNPPLYWYSGQASGFPGWKGL